MLKRQHGPHLEPAALAWMKLDRAAMQTRDALDDRQSQARAARLAVRVLAALEWRLEAFEFFRAQPFAAIADGDMNRARVCPRPDGQPCLSVDDGVLHQVHHE